MCKITTQSQSPPWETVPASKHNLDPSLSSLYPTSFPFPHLCPGPHNPARVSIFVHFTAQKRIWWHKFHYLHMRPLCETSYLPKSPSPKLGVMSSPSLWWITPQVPGHLSSCTTMLLPNPNPMCRGWGANKIPTKTKIKKNAFYYVYSNVLSPFWGTYVSSLHLRNRLQSIHMKNGGKDRSSY